MKRFPQATRVPGKVLLRIDARIHFSNVSYIEKVMESVIIEAEENMGTLYDVVIDMGGANDIDTAGIEALERLIRKYKSRENINVWFVELKGPVRDLLLRAGWDERFPDVMSYLPLDEFLKKKQEPNDYMI